MRLIPTSRGFLRADFKDANGEACSIQESSASGGFLWLGQNQGTHHDGQCMARMHVDRKLARQLILLLQKFVEQGDLRRRARKARL